MSPIAFFLLALVTALALALRLWGLKDIGVGGNDTILYYSLAEHWLQGDFIFRIGDSVQVFRPVLLGFNALALKVFGHVDYAIKLANALLDIVNLLLVSLLAWFISRSRQVVLACALTYAILPIAIWSARQELPHTLSTCFALGAFLCVWLATSGGARKTSEGFTFLAGFCVGMAALTHEELIFLAAPLALFLVLAPRLHSVPLTLASACRRVALFSAAPVVAGAIVMYFESSAVRSVFAGTVTGSAPGGVAFPEKYGRFLWDAIVGSSSACLALLVVLCLVYLAICSRPGARARGAPITHWVGFCLLVPIVFVGIYACFFNTLFPRGFLPLLPLLIIAIFCVAGRVTQGGNGFYSGTIVALLMVLLALSNMASFSAFNVADRRFSQSWARPVWPTGAALQKGYRDFSFDAKYARGYATHWQAVFKALEAKVDVHRKLLVMPSEVIYSPGRRPLQTRVYFGDNAVYRLDHAGQSLDEIVRQYDVRWVVFSVGQLRSAPSMFGRYLYNGRWAAPEPLDLADAYEMEVYSSRAEFNTLLNYLHTVGATEVFPFAVDSFESRVAKVWMLPPP